MYSEQFMRLWQTYRSFRSMHETYRSQADTAYAAMKRAESELVQAMLDADATTFEVDGMKPYLSADRECSVTKDNIEQVTEWLNSQRGGAEPFMRTAVDPWAVKRLVREELKDGVDPESYPAFLKVAVRPRLNVKGWIGSSNDGEEGEG